MSAASLPASTAVPTAAPTAPAHALVTGAGSGIGRAIALHLARAGWAVACVGRARAPLEAVAAECRALGARAVALPGDVSDGAVVEGLVAAAEDALGPLGLLVNNAGHGGVQGPSWTVDADAWWRTFEVNLRAPFLCARAALARMTARGAGRIINVSSRAGNVPVAHASAYATSKAALTRLTEVLALEAAPHGVRVFALEPGQVRTAMTEALIDGEAGRRWLPWYRTAFDAGQDVAPDEAGALVVRLARGDADALSGRFVSRADDLDALVAAAADVVRDERRVLRVRP